MKKIMIVVDDAIIALDIEECVKRQGYEVLAWVFSSDDAIRRVEAEQPDLVILSFHLLGDTDGLSLAKELHGRFGVPMLITASVLNKRLQSFVAQHSTVGCIEKPFSHHELIALVDQLLAE